MKLWEHPRLTGALCAAAVLACAAMPAAFLAVTDAAYIGRVVPVAEPYTAPTPAADDYYILRQLAARRQDSAELPRAEEPTAPGTPKMYIGASASLESMNYADAATADAAEQALQRLADCGVLPGDWAVQQDTAAEEESYTDYDGRWYDLSAAFCATDSLGFVTVRRYTLQGDMLLTRSSVTMDSRTGAVVEVWLSLPAGDAEALPLPDETALRAFAAQAGLESLGDWAVPADSAYRCALCSENGQALITASTHPYTYGSYRHSRRPVVLQPEPAENVKGGSVSKHPSTHAMRCGCHAGEARAKAAPRSGEAAEPVRPEGPYPLPFTTRLKNQKRRPT
ncbi:MAG: hypothetical protein ACLURG_12950 [Gemmiger sp.]